MDNFYIFMSNYFIVYEVIIEYAQALSITISLIAF